MHEIKVFLHKETKRNLLRVAMCKTMKETKCYETGAKTNAGIYSTSLINKLRI